jgi:2-C-methyl-D-erythritol 4-phosphate cytidylyltransferase
MGVLFSAVVVSAGGSTRFRASSAQSNLQSKQLVEWEGKPLIVHTLEALLQFSWSQVALVVPMQLTELFTDLVSTAGFSDQVRICQGGARRQDSVRAGLKLLDSCDRVAIHDGARPFLESSFIERLRTASAECPAVIPVQRISETVKMLDASSMVTKTLPRERIVRVQTPQFFDFQMAKEIHDHYKDSPTVFTDDAMMFESYGLSVKAVDGCSQNIKVTTLEDLAHVKVKEYNVG